MFLVILEKVVNKLKKPFLLDFDGVICDSVPEQYRVATAVLRSFGVEPRDFQSYRNMTRLFDWFSDHNTSQTVTDFLLSYWQQYQAENCFMVEDAIDVLTSLSERYEFVVVSSAKKEYVAERIKSFGIGHFFSQVHAGEDKKAQTIRNVCMSYGICTQDTFFVGDMRSDVDCGNEAGVKTILLADTDSPHREHAYVHITQLKNLLTHV